MTINLLFVTEDHSPENFGITTVLSQLANQLVTIDNPVNLTIASTSKKTVRQNPRIRVELIPPYPPGNPWRWSPKLKKQLISIFEKNNINLVHIHGIWMAVQYNGLQLAQQRNLPVVLTSHGMLEPWLWDKQGILTKIKKQIYFKYIFRKLINKNTNVHAMTKVEQANLRNFFLENPYQVIPNAVELPTIESKTNDPPLRKTITFLGRLHPIKGIDILIRAFKEACLEEKWNLDIIGPDTSEYAKFLKDLVHNLGISKRVKFLGEILGDQKTNYLQSSWLLVVPSYSEVIGMVNLEAAASSLPSITTYETGLCDWEDGGGMLIHPNVDELRKKLIIASQWRLGERLQRGKASYQLVKDRYSWEAITPQWLDFYASLVQSA